MNTETHSLYSLKDGNETRYMLLSNAREAAKEKRAAERAAANNNTVKNARKSKKSAAIVNAETISA